MNRAAWAFVLVLASALEARAMPSRPEDRFDDTFRKYAKRFFGPGVDWRQFKAQAFAESSLKADSKSPVGARGVMQLMPKTFAEIQSEFPEFVEIHDPEWNIAAGIYYDSRLWKLWSKECHQDDRHRFMFGSYNAGRATLLRAQTLAKAKQIDPLLWSSICSIAPELKQWKHKETLGYVEKIEQLLQRMDPKGRIRHNP